MSTPAHLKILEEAEALADKGDCARALPMCDRVLSKDSEDAAALTLKGRCLTELGRPKEALPCYKLARLFLPSYSPVRYNLGKALAEAGDSDGALAEFNEALNIDAGNQSALSARAALLSARGDHKGALSDCDELMRRNPDNPSWRMMWGRCLLAANRLPEAKREFDLLLSMRTKWTDEIYRLSWGKLQLDPNAGQDEPHGPL